MLVSGYSIIMPLKSDKKASMCSVIQATFSL